MDYRELTKFLKMSNFIHLYNTVADEVSGIQANTYQEPWVSKNKVDSQVTYNKNYINVTEDAGGLSSRQMVCRR